MTGGAAPRSEPVLAALALPVTGQIVSLAMPINNDHPIWPVHGPFLHFNVHSYVQGGRLVTRSSGTPELGMLVDRVELPLHAGTHVDALNHIAVGDRLVDGSRASDVETSAGARVLGIDTIEPFVGRGVLLDIAALHDVASLPADHVVGVADVDAAVRRAGIEAIEPGDVVLIHTGWMDRYDRDRRGYFEREPGLDVFAAAALADRGIRAVGADTSALEQVPADDPLRPYPVHELLLAGRGIHIFENVVTAGLAAARATTFLFVAAPLTIRGATGSPLNPLAIL